MLSLLLVQVLENLHALTIARLLTGKVLRIVFLAAPARIRLSLNRTERGLNRYFRANVYDFQVVDHGVGAL